MTIFPETDESLIAQVQNLGDGASWREIVRIYHPVIFRMARRRGMQDADANDVSQQVFIKLAKSIDQWQPSEGAPPFRAWLATIATNAITNALTRRPKDQAIGGTSIAEKLQAFPSPEATRAELQQEVKQQVVLWAIEQIRHEFSDAVWLSFQRTAIDGESIESVANDLHRSLGSIYVARYRVIARLKEKVQEASNCWKDFSDDAI